MFTKKVMVLSFCLIMTTAASVSTFAGDPLGTPVGAIMGQVMSVTFGAESSLAVGGVLMIATVSLAIGIRMVKRKTEE